MVDTVVINSTQPTEDPAHVQAMVAKADAAANPQVDGENTQSPENQTEDRPSWLPEKFNSPEDLAKAYAELQSKFGSKSQSDAPTDTPATTPDAEVKDALESKGLDLSTFSEEYGQKGELSPESYQKLQEAGYPRNIVDEYIEGQKARGALYESEVKSIAGGNEQFNEMVDWARANLSPQEINAYNNVIDSGDPSQAKLAVAGIFQKFSSNRPTEPNLFKATNSAQSNDAYESIAQMQKDMANPDYAKDPAFRAKVERKLARSTIL
jgi:hypothetical protein